MKINISSTNRLHLLFLIRKKKIVADKSVTPSTRKKVGCPKKDVSSEQVPQCEYTQCEPSSSNSICSSSHRMDKTLQVYDLKKRTSDISIFYDSYVGPPLDKFHSSKLPHQRVVLQRYRYLLTSESKQKRDNYNYNEGNVLVGT